MTAQPPMGPPQQNFPGQPPFPGQQPHGGPPQPGYQPPGQPPQKKSMSTGCIIAIVVTLVMGVPALGVVAALGIYGTRRYLASSKTAEAKNTIGAISRGAAAAYERERPVGEGVDDSGNRLCASEGPDAADHGPVPATVPAGRKYQPNTTSGNDYETGTAEGGWRCIRFAMTQPHYYQYHYNQGGNYQTSNPSLPGDEGYEAAAIGDLDADGAHSEFSTTGKIRGDKLKRSTQLYIENEFE